MFCVFFSSYENKGVQWMKSKPTLPPGLYIEETKNNNVVENKTPMSKSAKKNAKRKEKKKHKDTHDEMINEATDLMEDAKLNSEESKPFTDAPATDGNSQDTDITKKLRNLRKKLKQIQQLEAKLDSGEVTELTKEQFEKVAKKQLIEDEIEDLESELENNS